MEFLAAKNSKQARVVISYMRGLMMPNHTPNPPQPIPCQEGNKIPGELRTCLNTKSQQEKWPKMTEEFLTYFFLDFQISNTKSVYQSDCLVVSFRVSASECLRVSASQCPKSLWQSVYINWRFVNYPNLTFFARFSTRFLKDLAYRAIDIPCALGNGRVNHFS